MEKGVPEAENKLFDLVFPHLLALAKARMKRKGQAILRTPWVWWPKLTSA
jgi:hypothetical protein